MKLLAIAFAMGSIGFLDACESTRVLCVNQINQEIIEAAFRAYKVQDAQERANKRTFRATRQNCLPSAVAYYKMCTRLNLAEQLELIKRIEEYSQR